MKVPLSWLNEYVDAGTDAAAVARALIGLGIEVASFENGVLDLEITSNRADLLSMIGVARELALLGRARRPNPPSDIAESGPTGDVPIEVKDPAFCPRYIGRVVRGVKPGGSPSWMRERLEAAGIRSINVVADITNYVMLECGQPLHAFDLAKLKGGRIIVRRAAAGEKIVAIDGKEYTLAAADGVIADAERPVAVAGVMGGRDSEIGAGTRDILLESAMFEPGSVRATSRRLRLPSESSYRFERGVDWEGVEWASRRAARLLAELGGGQPAPGAADVASRPPSAARTRFRPVRLKRVLGLAVSPEKTEEIFQALGCKEAEGEIVLPAHRRDLKSEVDLIEEIARIVGYDKIPTDIHIPVRVARPHPTDPVRKEIRETLAASGAFEVLTSSFDDASAPGLLPIRNPDGHVDRTLRASLAPSLRAVLRTNEGSREPLRPVFEIAKVYRRSEGFHSDPELGHDQSPFDEQEVLGIAAPGGFSEARALVSRVLTRLGILGETQVSYNRQGPWVVAEADFASLAKSATLVRKTRPHSIQPAVVRDVSMIFDEKVRWEQVEAIARAEAGPHLVSVGLFDLFDKIGKGKKSFAFSLRFLAPDRTLTGAEIDPLVERVRAALKARLGGVER
ncbi:MAG TPA: phenylalanine--tRNA ligase subunit beta [Planctomycetota bacterium]|nr:phenylalanine--tRNA ligase subunit beta [Planctomycetota bacterium]